MELRALAEAVGPIDNVFLWHGFGQVLLHSRRRPFNLVSPGRLVNQPLWVGAVEAGGG